MKKTVIARALAGLAIAGLAGFAQAAAQPTFLQEPTRVTTTTDHKGVGYPDARKIVADGKGNRFLAFRTQASGDAAHVFVARQSNGVWNTPVRAENISGLIQRVPGIGIASDDSLHVSWYGIDPLYKSPSDYRQIKYIRGSTDGSWSGDSNAYYNIAPIKDTSNCLSSSKWWQEHPAVQVGKGKSGGVIRNDMMFIVWESRDSASCSTGQVRFHARPLDGSAAGFTLKIPSTGSGNFSRPTVIPSTDGNVLHVLAYGAVGGVRQIVWTRSQDGGRTWSAWQAVGKSGNDQRHVSAAVDAGNNLHVTWREKTSSSYSNIMYGVWNGSTWSKSTVTAGQASAFRSFPSLSVFRNGTGADAAQKVAVVWVQSGSAGSDETETRGNVFLSVRDTTSASATAGSWSAPLQLNARSGSGVSAGKATYPSLRWSPYGQQSYIDVVWSDGAEQGSDSTSRCPSGGCPIFYARLNQDSAAGTSTGTATAEPVPTESAPAPTTADSTNTTETRTTYSVLRSLLGY